MTNQSRTRVLIVDNDPQVRTDLREILEPMGYRVQAAQGAGGDLMNQAIALAHGFRPHVAIVDVRLLDEYSDDRSGLRLLEGLQSAARILYSAYLTPELTLEVIKRYDTTRWVSKHQSPQQLLDEVESAARETSRQYLTLERPPGYGSRHIVDALFGPDSDVPVDIIEDTIGQLFPDHQQITLQPLGGEAVTPFSVPRGRSVVLKAYPGDLEPVVVKLAPAKHTQNEARNYQEHVKGRLVGQFYAHLERTVEFWDLGGASYDFLGSSVSALPSFTAFYRQQSDPAAILRPLAHFFKEVWSRHYGRPISRSPLSMFQVYDQALRLRRRLESFSYQSPRPAGAQRSMKMPQQVEDSGVPNLFGLFSGQEKTLALPGLAVSVTNPVAWALGHAEEDLFPEAGYAITHGDMHADNLFVDGERAWAIDFERTGPGHILRDFVELEVDILTRLVAYPDDVHSQLYELAVALALPSEPGAPFQLPDRLPSNPETRKALEVIAGLRRLAHEVTGYQDFREYLWGLLLDSLFVAALVPEGSPQRERALLLGGVICDCLQDRG